MVSVNHNYKLDDYFSSILTFKRTTITPSLPSTPNLMSLTNDFEFTGAPGVAIFVGGLTLPSSSIIWIDLVDDQSVHALDVLKIIVFGGLDSDVVMEPLNLRLRATGH